MRIPEELTFKRRAKLPVFISSELGECGLACVAMVAVYHGHDLDLNSLRQRFSMSIAGANLRGLVRLADHIGLAARALRVELPALNQVALPAIVHWGMNHFVVLKSVSKSGAVIHDPARGKVQISPDELSNRFTGVVLELSPAADFQKIAEKKVFKLWDFFSRIRGHGLAAAHVLLLSIALQAITLLLPFQMQLAIDKAIDGSDAGFLLIVAVSFGALTLLNALIQALRDWSLQLLGSQVVFQVAGNVFRHLIRLSASFFEKRHLGDVLSRLGAVRQVQEVLAQGMLSAVIDGAMVIAAGIILVMYSPGMAAIVALTVFVFAAITIASYPSIRRQTEGSITASANEQTYLMESIRGIVPLKLMGGEALRESHWRNLYARSFNETMAVARTRQRLKFVEDVIYGLQFVAVLYVGASSILRSQGFSVGMLFSFLAFRAIFVERMQILVSRGLQFGMLSLYVQRLGDFLTEPPEVRSGSARDVPVAGNIRVQDVSFRYGVSDPWVLEKVNLEIDAGEFVAIIGRTGSGKTTLLKLLLGLQRPTEGCVLLDGERAEAELWQAWRTRIGVVRQDDQLFSGTLADNICFFDPNADMAKVREAAVAARVHGDIEKMPAKYLTLVGDMGSNLSGGQKQRILLARALYRSPSILILDEGTASLDPATEELIGDTIADMKITRILVAHRPTLLRRASRVFKVEDKAVTLVEANDGPSRISAAARI